MTTTYPPMPECPDPDARVVDFHTELQAVIEQRFRHTGCTRTLCEWQNEGHAGHMLRFSGKGPYSERIAFVVDHNGEFGIGLYDSWQAYCEAGTLPGPERWISLDVPFDYPNLVAAICTAWVTGP
jgi:hypothetical protein